MMRNENFLFKGTKNNIFCLVQCGGNLGKTIFTAVHDVAILTLHAVNVHFTIIHILFIPVRTECSLVFMVLDCRQYDNHKTTTWYLYQLQFCDVFLQFNF